MVNPAVSLLQQGLFQRTSRALSLSPSKNTIQNPNSVTGSYGTTNKAVRCYSLRQIIC